MVPPKNLSTRFYKRTIKDLASLFGRTLGRIFEIEDIAALANLENTRLHLENAQLRQEISALQNQIDNLCSRPESNTPAGATHPSTPPPEKVPDPVNLHRATRRSK